MKPITNVFPACEVPLGISNDLPWGGGGVWIFSGTTQYMMDDLNTNWPH